MAQTRLEQFNALKPSFLGFGWGGLKRIAERTYELGKTQIQDELSGGNSTSDISALGMLDVGGDTASTNWPLRHGHVPNGAPGIPDELSGACPYVLSAHFNN